MELGWEALTLSTFKSDSDVEIPGFLPIVWVLGSNPLLSLAGHSQQLPEMGPGGGEGEIFGFLECDSVSL